MTRQRALILQIMRQNPRHLSAEEILVLARQQMPQIARGTVYRNLKLMEAEGEIGHLEIPGCADVYDKTSQPHGHTLCVGCGSLADYPLANFGAEMEQTLGTKILGYQVIVKILCPKCRKNINEL